MKNALFLYFLALMLSGCAARSGLSEQELAAREQRLQGVTAKIVAAGNEICLRLYPESSRCAIEITMQDQSNVNVGTRVSAASPFTGSPKHDLFATAGTLDIIQNEGDLAMLIAHEYAHIIMGHWHAKALPGFLSTAATTFTRKDKAFKRTSAERVRDSIFRPQSFSESEEIDADYFSYYLVARAGYSVPEAAEIWNTPANEKTRYYFATMHLMTENRTAFGRRTMDEIAQKKRKRQPLLPDLE